MANVSLTGPGLLAFTPSLQLLCMTDGARELCDRLNRSSKSRATKGVLPRAVLELGEEIATRLRATVDPKDWEQAQLTYLVGDRDGAVLLSGVGMPSFGGLEGARIVVLMEAVDPEKTGLPQSAQERFRLTDREQTIVIYLLQGLTNKQIANRMGISIYTVKEHFKRLMPKAHSTTRAGLAAKILLAAKSE